MQLTKNVSNLRQNSVLQMIDRLIVWSPWIWLAILSVFVSLVIFQFGSWPSYGQPDPNFAGAISILYTPTMLVMFFTLLVAPIGVAASVFKLWESAQISELSRSAIFYLVGLGVYLSLTWFDMLGLMVWLFD